MFMDIFLENKENLMFSFKLIHVKNVSLALSNCLDILCQVNIETKIKEALYIEI